MIGCLGLFCPAQSASGTRCSGLRRQGTPAIALALRGLGIPLLLLIARLSLRSSGSQIIL